MEININNNNNNKNNNNMPVGTGSTASSKQDVEGSISSILIFKSFFCFLFYPLSFFVFCPHCERKAGQDATWTLQRTLWQSGRGNRGVKRGALEGGGERGVKGACLLICHKNGRHVMMANVEQIGLEEERQRKGERRQTAQLALCQQYQDMSTERNLPLHSALTLVAVSVLCVGITCEDMQFPGWNTEFYLCHTSC